MRLSKMMLMIMVCVVVSVLVLAGCETSTSEDYVYQPAFHVAPVDAITIGNRQLSLKLLIQTPNRNCWGIDKVLFSTDTDTVAKIRYVQNNVSIKHLISKPCTSGTGFDTLYSDETITFEKAGLITVRFTQVDSRGNFINRSYQYDIKD